MRKKPIIKLRQQKGWLMMTVSFAVILTSIVSLYTFREQARKEMGERAEIQADALSAIRTAAEILVFEHYVDYQEGVPVTRGGVTLSFGNSPGQALRPTVAQLRQMNLGINGASDVGSYKSLTEGGYSITINRTPAGCEASPSGVDCNITGLVCADRPVRDYASPNGEVDSFGIGKILARIGANAGASALGGTGEIVGAGGAWTAPNPISGAPEGIVCARFGFGVAEYWNFLRVRDSRDPNFMNNVTLKGGLHVKSTATYGGACTTDGMAMWGDFEGNPVWLQCKAGKWEPGNGMTYKTEGSACTQERDFAMTTGNIALVCSNGKWVSQARSGLRTTAYYQNGITVPTPACTAGLTPSAVVAAVSASNIIGSNNPGNNTGSFQATINSSWRVSIVGSGGQPAGNNAMALVMTFCNP